MEEDVGIVLNIFRELVVEKIGPIFECGLYAGFFCLVDLGRVARV